MENRNSNVKRNSKDNEGTSSKRINPIIERFVTSDTRLETILQETTEPRPVLAQASLYMQECLNGKRLAKDAVQAARSVPIKGSDPELLVLMLSAWTELLCHIGQPAEAEILTHRIKPLMCADTHPEIRAKAMQAEAILADATGNKAKAEQIMRNIIKLLPPFSPRRKFHLWELGLFLAQQGRCVEYQSEMKELTWQCNDNFELTNVLVVQYINNVETGRTLEATQLAPQIAGCEAFRHLSRIRFTGYQTLLKLMDEHSSKWHLFTRERKKDDLPIWIQVIYSLLSKDTEEALRIARLDAEKMLSSIFGSGFDSYNMIRAELAAGKKESALRLIKMRESRGNKHYLNDLFMARAELLNNNSNAASQHFAETIKAVEYYRARGRLDFELRLACELSPDAIVRLTQSAEKKAHRSKTSQPSAGSSPLAQKTSQPLYHKLDMILGRSPEITEIRQTISRFAELDAPVLVTGETGTGKELIAKALHEISSRSNEPFVAVNCGSITDTLLESELFGHERGSFTGAERANKGLFEEARGGTIFLDEIGEISRHLQAALLRVLETSEIRAVGSTKSKIVNCRIIAATNSHLNEIAEQNLFRKDLLFRLQRLGIHIPPLRKRPDDIMPLARHFMDAGRPMGIHAVMSNDLKKKMQSYEWPGNVRELRNVIERMRLMHSDKLSYDIEDLDLKFHTDSAKQNAPNTESTAKPRPEPEYPPETNENIPDKKEKKQSDANAHVDDVLSKGRSPVRQLERLRKLFERCNTLTRSEIIELLDISPNTATKYLKTLCDENLVERIEPSQSTRSHYFVLKQSKESPSTSSPTSSAHP